MNVGSPSTFFKTLYVALCNYIFITKRQFSQIEFSRRQGSCVMWLFWLPFSTTSIQMYVNMKSSCVPPNSQHENSLNGKNIFYYVNNVLLEKI